MVEQLTLNQRVVGSNPTAPTIAAGAPHEAERLDLIAVAQELRAADTRHRLATTELLLSQTQARLATATDDLVHKDIQIAHFREFAEAYHTLIGSNLWQALQPVRRAASAIPPPLRRAIRRGGKAALWAATLWRLSARLARRRERIALANAVPPPPVIQPPPPPPPPDPYALAQIDEPRTGYVPLIRWFDPIAPEVSIVVLNWNGGAMTLLCLQHLWQHTTGHRYEIIVVDNGSDPAEVETLRAQAPFARIVAIGANRYVGEANNIGVEAARGAIVCLLDNDAFVPPGWLEPLMAAFAREPGVGAVGPRLLSPDGTIQETGALIGSDGTITPIGKGAAADDPAYRVRRVVDFVSATCLLVRRQDFLRVLGFDLAWDPASYEDADLCFKLRLLGLTSHASPETSIVHFGGATRATHGKSLRLHDIVAINRSKFLARWSRLLATGEAGPADLLPAGPIGTVASTPRAPRLRLVLYTPYQLTPGGGERYLLTIAESFKDVAVVTLVTPQPISRVRLLTMGREFGLDLDQVELLGPSELAARPLADLAIVLGNEIFPTVGRMARRNIYICQFPFPFEDAAVGERRKPLWHEFDLIVVYSEYVRGHVLRISAQWNVPYRPVEILAPPVPMIAATAPKRPSQILHVGRFFADGHCKRQDRLIDGLRLLRAQGVDAELHLAGSTMPEAQHRAYYSGLIEQAAGLPVHFHANCSTETLHALYAESGLYWHATGVGADIEAEPEVAEHFGISVVEAMSAGCIPLVFAAGGPATIVQDGVTGYHFRTIEELAAKTRAALETLPAANADAMRTAARAAARPFDEPTFRERVRTIADRLVHVPTHLARSDSAGLGGT